MATNLLANLDQAEHLQTLQGLARLAMQNGHDLDRLKRLLISQQDLVNKELRIADGAFLNRAQGRAKFIDELLDLISNAPRLANEMGVRRA